MNVQVQIIDGPLSPQAPTWHPEGAGAVIAFEGIVRPSQTERPIAALRYESYDPMAQRQLQCLSGQAMRRFGLIGLHVWHSRGLVQAGACAFRLMVASAHRQEALAAVDWFINALKRDVPIWKHAVPAPHPAPLEG